MWVLGTCSSARATIGLNCCATSAAPAVFKHLHSMRGMSVLLLSVRSVIYLYPDLLLDGYYYFHYNPRLFVAHIVAASVMGDLYLVHVSSREALSLFGVVLFSHFSLFLPCKLILGDSCCSAGVSPRVLGNQDLNSRGALSF